MKLYSPLLVVLLMADACWSQCRNANWLVSFEKKGWSTCGSSIEYITGFYRDKKTPNEPISLVEEARCCKAPLPIQNQPSTCVDADWWTVLDRLVNSYKAWFKSRILHAPDQIAESSILYVKCDV